jgi:hypothetical protein
MAGGIGFDAHPDIGIRHFIAEARAPITPLPPPAPPSASPAAVSPAPSGPLPFTGFMATWYGVAALALLTTGALILVGARRGRRGATRRKHAIRKA